MTLFEECINALKSSGQLSIYDSDYSSAFIQEIKRKVSFTKWGRIDWNSYVTFEVVDLELLNNLNGNFYIFWNEANLPVIHTNFKNIIRNIDDVLAVDFDTWLVSSDLSCIIEFFHNGQERILYF